MQEPLSKLNALLAQSGTSVAEFAARIEEAQPDGEGRAMSEPLPLREQFRQVFALLWRVLRVNPLRVYGLLYYRVTRDEDMGRRVERWIAEA
jgi:hypothetical protein